MDHTEYWWKADMFSGESLLLKPDEAEIVMLAKKVKDSVMIPRLRMQIDTKSIASIEQTAQPLPKVALPGNTSSQTAIPIVGRFPNSIRVQFVKRHVPYRIWERQYANIPGYHLLRRNEEDADVWVVFTRPMFEEVGLPEGLYELEDWEEQLIERKVAHK